MSTIMGLGEWGSAVCYGERAAYAKKDSRVPTAMTSRAGQAMEIMDMDMDVDVDVDMDMDLDLDMHDPVPGSPVLADAGADGHGDGHGPTVATGRWAPQRSARAGARHGARLKRSKSGEVQAVRARPTRRAKPARRASGDGRDRLISHFDFAPEKPAAPGLLCALAAAVCQTAPTASTTARLLCCHLISSSSPPPSLILSLPRPRPRPRRPPIGLCFP
jgi:hypothetical protein